MIHWSSQLTTGGRNTEVIRFTRFVLLNSKIIVICLCAPDAAKAVLKHTNKKKISKIVNI